MINSVTAAQAYHSCNKVENHTIIDVRTLEECARGTPKNAINIALENINQLAEQQLDKNHHYYFICQIGIRSKLACQQMLSLGFNNVYDVDNGFNEWQSQNLPTITPKTNQRDLRYSRHHKLSGFGRTAQKKLSSAHVVIIGAGGLGSPSALYLAAAGVGIITIVDDDLVQLSNLQRQILHTTKAIGSPKVESAKNQLSALNPDITINPINQKLNLENSEHLIRQADVIIDGTDNLSTRYIVNDTCVKYKKPLIYAAVYEYEAQISVFDLRTTNSPCLRCLFPQSDGFEPENCSTVGVLGVVPGFAGILQATEAIKIITKIGEPLTNKLLVCDLLDNSFRKIKYIPDNQCNHH